MTHDAKTVAGLVEAIGIHAPKPQPTDQREAVLFDWIVKVTAERDAYRLLAQQAIHHSHAHYVELARLRASYERLIGDCRERREQTMTRKLETV